MLALELLVLCPISAILKFTEDVDCELFFKGCSNKSH